MSLNRLRLRHLAENGHAGAARARRLLERPDRFVAFAGRPGDQPQPAVQVRHALHLGLGHDFARDRQSPGRILGGGQGVGIGDQIDEVAGGQLDIPAMQGQRLFMPPRRRQKPRQRHAGDGAVGVLLDRAARQGDGRHLPRRRLPFGQVAHIGCADPASLTPLPLEGADVGGALQNAENQRNQQPILQLTSVDSIYV